MGDRPCKTDIATMPTTRFIRHLRFFLMAIILVNLMLPASILAETSAVLANIRLANTRDDLLTYFEVRNAFTDSIMEAIQKGVPTTFSFYVSLSKRTNTLFDKTLADIKIQSTIKYNSMKEEYTVSRPWRDDKPVMTKSLEEAKEWMTEVDNLKVVPLADLTKGDKYLLRIKAELEKVTLPLSLHYVFFFVSFWDFETDWYVINFTY